MDKQCCLSSSQPSQQAGRWLHHGWGGCFNGWSLGPFLLLKTAGANDAHTRNNTTINRNQWQQQNLQWRGKTRTSAATTATDSQAGGKNLMSLSEKEVIKQNQSCWETVLLSDILQCPWVKNAYVVHNYTTEDVFFDQKRKAFTVTYFWWNHQKT